MNARFALCLAALVLASPGLAQDKGELRLPEFASLADKASDYVNVTLGPQMLGIAATFLNANDPEEAAAKKMVTSLTGIYVRKYTFENDYAYPTSDIDSVRRQLSAPGWSRMVEAKSNKEHTHVDVFVLLEGNKAKGLAIIASEPREFTIVNIVGSIDLEQLHDLKGLGVPDLQIESGKKPAPEKSSTAKK